MKFTRPSNHIGSYASDPSFGVAGNTYYNTTSQSLKVWTGSAWSIIGGGGGSGVWGGIGGNLSDQADLQNALNLKAPINSPTFTGTVGGITKSMVGLGNVDNTADSAKPVSTAQQTALDLKANLSSPSFTGVPLAPTASVNTDTTQIATTAFVVAEVMSRLASNDALVYKGAIDCSTNPNFPSADAGWNYKVSVAGKIGGASGVNVEVGDRLICNVDGSASGNQATVGANWDILQYNVDGVVTGQTSSVDGEIALFSGSSGRIIKRATGTGVPLITSGVMSVLSTTGTGNVVRDTSPTLVTPVLGVASATSINKMTITAPATSSTLAVADGKTATISNTLTFNGTDGSSVAFGAGGTVDYLGTAQTFTAKKTFSPTVSVSGLNVGAFAGDPSSPVNGDIHYNSTSNALRAYINGAFVSLGASGGGSSYDESNPINDSSSNELIQFYKTASAVNHIGVTNNSTGNAPIVEAVGGDTNIPLRIRGKGTSPVMVGTNPAFGGNQALLEIQASSVTAFKISTLSALSNACLMELGYGEARIATGNGTGKIQFHNGNYAGNPAIDCNGGFTISPITSGLSASVNTYVMDINPTNITNYVNGTTDAVARFGVTTINGNTAGRTKTNASTVVIDGSPVQGSDITITNLYALWVKGGVSKFDGVIRPASMADGSAPNDSIYYSTTASKLVYKDSGGTVNNLY